MADKNLVDKSRWLILSYLPVSLFSLRMTHATNKGGKTLLVPTPYAFKMTLIDACFRVFGENEAESKARQVFDFIKSCEIRFNPPDTCIVQNTFIKIRQEERDAPKGFYVPTIAYREFCFYYGGELKVAVEITGLNDDQIDILQKLGEHINCIGKRGSFWQYKDSTILDGELPKEYTHPYIENNESRGADHSYWTQYLDDFGKALFTAKDGFDRINTYGSGKITLGEHRVLVKSIIPYTFVKSSKHFTIYKKTE